VKRRLLVLGSFRSTASEGRVGGLGFACQSLVSSPLAGEFEFVPVDSTIESLRSRTTLARLPSAAARIVRSAWTLSAGRIDTALCFSSHGTSFLEKGVVVLAGRLLGRRMILLPRSGHLVRQTARSRLFRGFARAVLGRASVVVCQSAWWQAFYRGLAGGDPERFVVVENWLPEEDFIAADAPVAASGEGAFVVGYLNRVEADKGIYEFVEAVRRAHAANHAIRGVIYGDGREAEPLRARLAAEGLDEVITWGGWLDDRGRRRALRALDAYLFASHAEGFPNSLLQVIAQKVPVISVRVGAVVDMLEHGVSGLLTEVGDVQALAGHVLELAANAPLRVRLAEAAYARASAHNRLSGAVDRFRAILGAGAA
jgi:glycosyltransferase involved in cell wall biosynthesis